MPSLLFLEVDSSPVSGTLPDEWGSPSVFNQLGALKLTNCNISGDPTMIGVVSDGHLIGPLMLRAVLLYLQQLSLDSICSCIR